MNNDGHTSNARSFTALLLAIAAMLAAFLLLRVARFFVTSAVAEQAAAQAAHAMTAKSQIPSGGKTQPNSVVEQLKKSNLFAPPAPKQHPVSQVIGILGDEALINGRWYKVGDTVGEAKILAIEPTKVRVTWNDQEKEFAPITADGSAEGPGRPGPDRGRSSGRPSPPGGAPMVVTGSESGRPGGPPSLSQEERDKLRERWTNMSPEERERFRNEMRERFGRRDR